MNPVAIEDVYPLAPTQEGILFHTLNDSGTGAYFVQASLALQGQLDLTAFRQAWQTLVQRHPVLRTSFHWDELEQPLQIVHSTVALPFSVLDWRAVPEDQQAERLSTFLEADRREGLDLNIAPLFRITLIELGADRFQLVWSLNHIILDGWSISLLYQELFTIYSGLLSGTRAALRAAPPYSRYISWLQRQDMVAAEAFWRSLLADVTNPTPLLIEQPDCAAAKQETIVEIHRFAEPGLAEGLQSFARHERITISTLLHAAWSLVLRAYSGEDVVLFGSVSSGRPDTLPEAEQIAGLLLTTLPVCVSYTPETPVRQWLATVQHQLVERRQFDYSPLVQVHGWSNIPRGQPLFESILVFENYPLDDFLRGETGSLRSTDVKFITPTNYPLTIQVMFTPGLTFSLSYDAARFSAATAERVLDHLMTALTSLIGNPEARLSDLDVLPAHERQYVLTDLNAAPPLPVLDRPVAEYVASYAADPNRIAARAGDRSLTYAELAARANQVAHWLLSLQLPDDARIGVFAERDLEMLVVLLACLQTGYAYIPLDPAYPDPRLQQILRDSRCAVIATTSDLSARINSLSGDAAHSPHIWCWDVSTPELDAQPVVAPRREVLPHAVATVFYTSGSTGQPKGVMVEQIGLLNHLWAKVNILELTAASRVAQTAAHSFDISIWQFLAALLVGGEVVIYPTELVLNPFALFSRLQADGITILETVPTLLEALLTALDQQPDHALHLRDLAYLISNAETLAVPLSRRWHAAFPHIPLLNTYGATECSDDTTHIVMRAPLSDHTARVPVGQPIAGFQIYVVDQQLRPLPVGCPGQIAMAGIGVGQGYLGDPVKTASAFVPNPFAGRPQGAAGSRLYLTGDLGRWREDGQLDFLGRTDGQVKVRGHRIELGEVEAALVRCAGVHHAVAIVRSNAQQQLQLIGYVVGDLELRSERVREELGRLVPRYMIPSQILILAQMPLNVNGKIDRRALPEPNEDAESGAALDAPQTPVEEIVAEVWCQVLGLSAVGRHDHFFDHGGHSLLATQVISRLRQLFGVDLPLRTIFEQPTVAGLSSRIGVLRQHELNDNIPPLKPVPREQPLPLSFAQQRLWIMDQLVPNSALYSMPVVVRLSGALDRAALSAALDGLVARHESLRTRVDTVNGEPVQVIDAPATCPLIVSDLEAVPFSERESATDAAIRAFLEAPFDLRRGPLFRTQLLRVSDEQHLLALALHHIITDGWSTGVLLEDLVALYQAAAAGQLHRVPFGHGTRLPALPVQYADFAVWQRGWLQGEVLERQISYWRQQLAGAPALLELPTDHPRPAAQSFRGAMIQGSLRPELAEALRELSRAEGTTLFMTLLAGYQTLLARYSGQSDILVGVPIAGRLRPELASLIGFFVNTLVMRASLVGQPTVRDLLAQVRHVALDAYAHQDIPFEQLVEVLQPERTLSHTPIFQAAFTLQNTPEPSVELAGLSVSAMEEGDLGVAKFDLMLSVREVPDGELAFVVEYSTDLFEEATIVRMVDHYQRLLAGMAADPEQPVAAIDMLSDIERMTILNTWNATSQPYSLAPVYRIIGAQADRTPDAIALCVGSERYTYRQVMDDAYRLAHVLQARGVARGDRVGIFLSRQSWLIPALLAVHAAGAAYVPLDPAYPTERLALMAEDADLRLVISESALVDALPHTRTVLDVTSLRAELDAYPAADPEIVVTPDDLAYVIYTSGSTGRPKGVAIPHRGLSSFITWCAGYYPTEDFAGLVASTSVCFDLSVFEIFAPLACGGTIILVEDGLHMPSADHQPPVTLVNLIPSVVGELLQMGTLPPTVRTIVLGGEASQQPLIDEIYAKTGVRRIYNGYGPTEDTVYSTSMLLQRGKTVLIGQPISNTQAYILDPDLCPVPIGVVGDLYLGGDGQSWGYLHRPELTAERFVPHPLSGVGGVPTGSRLYKTGDLARYRADGQIEYGGRIDHQVKIRGFRIELGEIEAALHQHPAIQQAVAACYAGAQSSADSRIAAYVVARPGHSVDSASLLAYLEQRLPRYMLPAAFIAMEQLPHTPNGKVDRKALPTPDNSAALRAPYVAPQTPTEQLVAKICAELLDSERVGIDDNFFLLGGHSLLATQLLTQVQAQLGIEIPLRTFFESPTVGALSRQIDVLLAGSADEESEDLDDLLDLVEGFSDEEVAALLAQRLQTGLA